MTKPNYTQDAHDARMQKIKEIHNRAMREIDKIGKLPEPAFITDLIEAKAQELAKTKQVEERKATLVQDFFTMAVVALMFFGLGYFAFLVQTFDLVQKIYVENSMCSFSIKGDLNTSSLGENFRENPVFKNLQVKEFSATVPCKAIGMGG